MKLYEIEGYLEGVKIRHPNWEEGFYTYFNKGVWFDEKDKRFYIDEYLALKGVYWELYEEPKEKVMLSRYRIYDTRNERVYISDDYLSAETVEGNLAWVKEHNSEYQRYEKYGEEIEEPNWKELNNDN